LMINYVKDLIEKFDEREKVVYCSLESGVPLNELAKHVEWSNAKLKRTYRLLIWYLRYVSFYEPNKDYIMKTLSDILTCKLDDNKESVWGRKLILEMAQFPIRKTGYWAEKLGYKKHGNVSGSVLIALFVAESRIEAYLEEHDDTILRRWYLLFKIIQFGNMNFKRRFAYRYKMFEDLPEWEYVKKEFGDIRRYHNKISLTSEIKKMMARNRDKEYIIRHFVENYDVERKTVEEILESLNPIEAKILSFWNKNKNFAATLKKFNQFVTAKELTRILLQREPEALICDLLKKHSSPEVKRILLDSYGLKISDVELYKLLKEVKKNASG